MSKQILSILFILISLCDAKVFMGLQTQASTTFQSGNAVRDYGSKSYNVYDGKSLVAKMGMGFNMGNSLDAATDGKCNEGLSSETSWGNPFITQDMIRNIKNKGFKSIRLPTSWHNHIIDNNYTIDPNWTKRVKQIVDWCIDAGLYVILNTHHDNAPSDWISYGAGYYPSQASKAESLKFLVNVWSQITLAFNNGYGDQLIFEALNEPRMRGTDCEWWTEGGCTESVQVVNEFNNNILQVIRASGGNNAKRFVMVTAPAAARCFLTHYAFQLPSDSKILISVHLYQPYDFAMNGDNYQGWGENFKSALIYELDQVYNKFRNYGIVIGEMGATNKNNLADRIQWAKFYLTEAKKRNMAPVVWDNGSFGSGWEAFGLFRRNQGYWEYDELVKAYISASQ